MNAILLCAGFGTRMYPLTRDTAKPLLPVAGRPIVDHLVEQLRPWIDHFVVVCNARFHDQFRQWAPADCTVVDDGAHTNETRLGAVRDLALALRHAEPGPVVVAGGDNLFRFSFAEWFDAAEHSGRSLVIAHDEPDLDCLRRSGVPEIDGDDRIVALWEKPQEPPTRLACPALYLLQPPVLELLPRYLEESDDCDALGRFIGWACQHTDLHVHRIDGERLDVGDLETYRRAEQWIASRGGAT